MWRDKRHFRTAPPIKAISSVWSMLNRLKAKLNLFLNLKLGRSIHNPKYESLTLCLFVLPVMGLRDSYRDSCLGLGIPRPSFLGLGQGTGTLRAVIASMGGAAQGMLLSMGMLLSFPQFAKVLIAKNLSFCNSRKFSPAKDSCYTASKEHIINNRCGYHLRNEYGVIWFCEQLRQMCPQECTSLQNTWDQVLPVLQN